MTPSKRILIIGATSGLGREIAAIYARRGCCVMACGRKVEALNELKSEFPDPVATSMLDVNADDCAERLNLLLTDFAPDTLINCAGIGWANPELDIEIDRSTVMTNCLGFTTVADTAFNYFASRGIDARLAAISSVASTKPLPIGLSYSASKRYQAAYLEGLNLLRRIKHLPLTITDVRPGYVATPLLDPTRRYPMLMQPERAARLIVKAIDRRRRVAVIDTRWLLLVGLWRLIPSWLWVRLPIKLAL
ncbi:MAG: SDR family NAD(P)-dependent oxidoreductase [Muribaculaceae bacterium]|nr:SDR family NAD(P)-dependent oxidoreductase [Muribaculaceae bacterium]